jgi:quercetin dioxygenase-like cupin family protein
MSNVEVIKDRYKDKYFQKYLREDLKEKGFSSSPFMTADCPGKHYKSHSHDQDEFIYVSSGRFTFKVEGKTYEINGGEAIILPAGTIHEATAADSDGDDYAGNGVRYFMYSKE